MINENWREDVLSLADSYCAKENIKRTVLSNRVAGDADFLDHIATGGGCTVDKLQRIMAWFEENMTAPPRRRNGKPRRSKAP